MSYDLSNGDKNFSMQDLANIVGRQAITVDTMIKGFSNLTKSQADMAKKLDVAIKDISGLKEWKRQDIENRVVNKQERRTIRRAVHRRVFELLELPWKVGKEEWTRKQRDDYALYSNQFHRSCYSEVSKLGHLGSPYDETLGKFYDESLKDIEAWYPDCGVDGLKRKAEENMADRERAKAIATAKVAF